jgi:hypothetical protein
MRKFVLATVAVFACVSLTIAAEVVFLKYDKEKKELTVKENDKEKTYKVTDDTTFLTGEKETKSKAGITRLERMEEGGKAAGRQKITIKTDGDKLTEVKFAPAKKKDG